MRCLVFERFRRGHRFNYVRHLLPAVAEVADDVILVLGEDAPGSVEYREHVEPVLGGVAIDASIPTLDRPFAVRGYRRHLTTLADAVRRHRADEVLVPGGDGLVQVTGVPRPVGVDPFGPGVGSEALMFRGGFAYPGTLKRRLMGRITLAALDRAPWTIVHYLDPIAFEAIIRRGGALGRRCRLMPEPVEPIERVEPIAARRRLGLPEDGRYIGCAGFLEPRKGAEQLLAAFDAVPRPRDDRLLLIGRLSSSLDAMIRERNAPLVRSDRLIVVDRYLSDQEFGLALSAMDVVGVPYVNHVGSSGIVVRAPVVGRPLLGTDAGWVGRTIGRFALGRTCDVLDPAGFGRAISRALDEAPGHRITEGGRRFMAFHTVENFAAAWTARLRERLGLPVSSRQRSWEWVCDAAPGSTDPASEDARSG